MKKYILLIVLIILAVSIGFLLMDRSDNPFLPQDIVEEHNVAQDVQEGLITSLPVDVQGIDSSTTRLGFNNAQQVISGATGSWIIFEDDQLLQLAHRNADGEVTDIQTIAEGFISLPAIIRSESEMVIAWTEGRSPNTEVRFVMSSDKGNTFSEAETFGSGSGVSLAASKRNVVAVWHNDTQANKSDILLRAFDGDQWSEQILVDDSDAEPLWASVALEGDRVYATWRDNRDGEYKVWVRRSLDLGSTWEDEQRMDNRTSGDPAICAQGKNVTVAYHQKGDIFIRHSTNNGETFEDPIFLDKGWFAHLSCVDDVIGVSWEATDKPSFAPGKKAGWSLFNTAGDILGIGTIDETEAAAATIYVHDDKETAEVFWILVGGDEPLVGTLRKLEITNISI